MFLSIIRLNTEAMPLPNVHILRHLGAPYHENNVGLHNLQAWKSPFQYRQSESVSHRPRWLIGHYESEQYTKEIFYSIIRDLCPEVEVQMTRVNTNPIKYL